MENFRVPLLPLPALEQLAELLAECERREHLRATPNDQH